MRRRSQALARHLHLRMTAPTHHHHMHHNRPGRPACTAGISGCARKTHSGPTPAERSSQTHVVPPGQPSLHFSGRRATGGPIATLRAENSTACYVVLRFALRRPGRVPVIRIKSALAQPPHCSPFPPLSSIVVLFLARSLTENESLRPFTIN